MEKELIISKINELMEVVKKYDESQSLLKKGNALISEIQNYKIRVLFVGGFSAGKSALLNALLDREVELLEEDQIPETAIASELVYDEKEFVELIKDKNSTVCMLEEIEQHKSEKYDFYRYHLNNPFLKKHTNFVFVDIPGFNSGVEKHDKAISRYVAQGNAYVLVIDCEDGELKSTSIDFIKEIRQYENNLAIAVSKTDKKIESDVEKIRTKIEITAGKTFRTDVKVIATSKFSDDVDPKIDSLIETFDSQDIFEQRFFPAFESISLLSLSQINSFKASEEFDDADLKEELARRKKAKTELSDRMQKEKYKLSQKIKNDIKPRIVEDIEDALYAKTSSLASSLISGKEIFSRKINQVIRPVLISSLNKNIETGFEEFVGEIDLSNKDFSSVKSGDFTKGVDLLSKTLKPLITKLNSSGVLYKAVVGTIAITTSFVAPLVEVVVLFLPELLNMLGLTGEKRQQAKAEEKVKNEIIPQVIERIEEEIQKPLDELEEEMMKELEARFGAQLDAETEALEQAEKMREDRKAEYQKMIQEINQDISAVESLMLEKVGGKVER